MQLNEISLQMDKSVSIITDYVRTIRQDEMGQILPVKLVGVDGQPYNLTGKTLIFNESKEGNKAVLDNDQSRFSITNAAGGQFTYTLRDQCYSASGTAYFAIKQGNTIIDTTQDFKLEVLPDAEGIIENNSYVSGLDQVVADTKAKLAEAQNNIDQLLKDISSKKDSVDNVAKNLSKQFDDKIADLNQDLADYQTKYNNLANDWNTELQKISDKANTDTQAAVNTINQKYINDFNGLKDNYNTWKSGIVTDVNKILDQIKQGNTDVTNLQAEIKKLQNSLGNIDFTQFVKPADLANYYTKKETDDLLATAGKVKTVQKIEPDANGDIEVPVVKEFDSPQAAYDASKDGNFIAVYDPDDGPTEAIIDGEKITISTLNDALKNLSSTVQGLSSTVDSKASQDDLTTLQNNVAAANASITDIQNSLKNLASSSTITDLQKQVNTNTAGITNNKKAIATINVGVTSFNGSKGDVKFQVNHTGYKSPQDAFDASKDGDGIYIYDPDDGPTSAVVDDKTITVSSNYEDIQNLQQQMGSKANSSDLSSYDKTTDVDSKLTGKANQTDLVTLQNRVAALENKKPIKASNQSDAVSKSKDGNWYYW